MLRTLAPLLPKSATWLALTRDTKLRQARGTYLVSDTHPYDQLNGEQEPMAGVVAFFGMDLSYLLERLGPIAKTLEQLYQELCSPDTRAACTTTDQSTDSRITGP